MMKASEFADALGRTEIAKATGVGLTAVSNAVVRDRLPSSWFIACSKLADAKGVDCPPSLFGMRDAVPETQAGIAGEFGRVV